MAIANTIDNTKLEKNPVLIGITIPEIIEQLTDDGIYYCLREAAKKGCAGFHWFTCSREMFNSTYYKMCLDKLKKIFPDIQLGQELDISYCQEHGEVGILFGQLITSIYKLSWTDPYYIVGLIATTTYPITNFCCDIN